MNAAPDVAKAAKGTAPNPHNTGSTGASPFSLTVRTPALVPVMSGDRGEGE